MPERDARRAAATSRKDARGDVPRLHICEVLLAGTRSLGSGITRCSLRSASHRLAQNAVEAVRMRSEQIGFERRHDARLNLMRTAQIRSGSGHGAHVSV